MLVVMVALLHLERIQSAKNSNLRCSMRFSIRLKVWSLKSKKNCSKLDLKEVADSESIILIANLC